MLGQLLVQKLAQICTVILRIRIGKGAWFAVYIWGNFWVTQYVDLKALSLSSAFPYNLTSLDGASIKMRKNMFHNTIKKLISECEDINLIISHLKSSCISLHFLQGKYITRYEYFFLIHLHFKKKKK